MVMTRSSFGIKFDTAFRNVVLPEPVPPEMKMLYFARTNSSSTCATSCVMEPYFRSCSTVMGVFENLPDRDRRTFHGDGWQYHIDTGAVRQTGIHDGIRLIDFTSGQTYDLLGSHPPAVSRPQRSDPDGSGGRSSR